MNDDNQIIDSIDISALNLKSEIIDRFRKAGFTTVESILASDIEDFFEIPRVGRMTAEAVIDAAKSLMVARRKANQGQQQTKPEPKGVVAPGPFVFASTYDCTKKITSAEEVLVRNPDGSHTKQRAKPSVALVFSQCQCTVNERLAEMYDTTVADIITAAKKFPGYGKEFYLVDGPGVPQDALTRHFKSFVRRARTELQSRRRIRVTVNDDITRS